MNLFTYCFAGLLLIAMLLPQIVLIIELHKYDQFSHPHMMSLVITNFVGVFPASQTLYYTLNKHYMVHEFVLFYLITLNSGTYHMCNKLNYTGKYCQYLPPDILMQLDYINSYFCIIATILYLAKFEFMNDLTIKNMIKMTIYAIEYIIVLVLTIKYRTTQLPALFTSLTLIVVLLIFVTNRNRYVELYFNWYRGCIFLIGFGFAMIAFITYLYISIYTLQGGELYWILHSYLWHVPVLISPVFIIESSTICEKSFFAWISEFFKLRNYEDNLRATYEMTDIEIG